MNHVSSLGHGGVDNRRLGPAGRDWGDHGGQHGRRRGDGGSRLWGQRQCHDNRAVNAVGLYLLVPG